MRNKNSNNNTLSQWLGWCLRMYHLDQARVRSNYALLDPTQMQLSNYLFHIQALEGTHHQNRSRLVLNHTFCSMRNKKKQWMGCTRYREHPVQAQVHSSRVLLNPTHI